MAILAKKLCFLYCRKLHLYDQISMTKSVENLARLDDARVDDAVINIQAISSSNNQAIMTHKCKMLRKIGLW